MRKRLAAFVAVVLLAALGTQLVSTDGTEQLGTPSIAIADGTNVVAAGTGMITQPGTIDITIPGGATVNQVLLYWEGQFITSDDDTISVDGNSVTGTLIGGPTNAFADVNTDTYRADITSLGLVSAGANSISVTDMDYDFANNGAGILAIIDDGTSNSIELRDGNDFAYLHFNAPRDTTVPQTFTFDAAVADRTATLDMFFSSVAGSTSTMGFRPSSIEVESGGATTLHSDVLNSNDGEEWDTVEISVDVPAGATSITVQALSRDDNASGRRPASFVWNTAALTLPTASVEGVIDIEKYTKIGSSNVPGDSCDTLGKPVILTMVYTGDGDDATSHSQDPSKVNVSGDPNDEAIVRIVAASKTNLADNKTKIWFDGVVLLGDPFDIDAATAGKDKLDAKTFVLVFDTNDNLLQTVEFHTSCSQPLDLGNQFGSALLAGWVGEIATDVLQSPVVDEDLGEDADTPTGPIAMVGDKVKWNYVVTNPGDVQLANIVVVDDNGTAGDTGDDFNPDPVLEGGFNVGDTDMDDRLDPGEEWLYMAMSIAVAGQYGNVSDVVGTPVDDSGTTVGSDVTDEDPSHYFAEVPVVDRCDSGKPVLLTLNYTGDGDDATSHSQDPSKVDVSGDPNDEGIVRIVAASKTNLADNKIKIWFDGVVLLGDPFDIDAATAGKDKLDAKTFVLVFDTNDNLLQTVEFHTSCSQPLFIGDQFGSVQLTGFVAAGS